MPYDIHLEVFEGPLDLLLYLIRRDDLNIYDIPVSQITAEYLEYLDLLKEMNLDVASEFLIMAATLMQIKAKAMLPVETIEESEGPDPKEELVAKLLEYQKYKKVAALLREAELKESGIYYRNAPIFSEEDYTYEANLFDLMSSFKKVLTDLPANVKEIIFEEIPIEQKIREVLDIIANSKVDRFGRKYTNFLEILELEKTRMGMIVLFLALLELIRLKQVLARQSKEFGDIRIYLVEAQPENAGDTASVPEELKAEEKPAEPEQAAEAEKPQEPVPLEETEDLSEPLHTTEAEKPAEPEQAAEAEKPQESVPPEDTENLSGLLQTAEAEKPADPVISDNPVPENMEKNKDLPETDTNI